MMSSQPLGIKYHSDDRYCPVHGWVGAQYWGHDVYAGQCILCVVDERRVKTRGMDGGTASMPLKGLPDMITIEYPSPSLPPGAYMRAETKYDLEREGALPKGIPIVLNEDVPPATVWVVEVKNFSTGATPVSNRHLLGRATDAMNGLQSTMDGLERLSKPTLEAAAAFSEGALALADVFKVFDSVAAYQPPSKEAVDAFTLRALDVACAAALGWTEIAGPEVFPEYDNYYLDPVGVPPEGTQDRALTDKCGIKSHIPHFSTDPTAARVLEDEITKRNLQANYISALMGILLIETCAIPNLSDPSDTFWIEPTVDQLWAFLTATPAQRARAFVEVTRNARI